jgi:cyclohexa-1,5-dienecarbonyl-CoA hydratase
MISAILPSFSKLTLAVNPPVAIVTLRNGRMNAIGLPMMDDLLNVLKALEARADITTIIFTGEGEHFSAGVDIVAHVPETVREMLTRFHAVIRALVKTPKVTIAAVRGNALGGGAELALMCDMIYCTEDSKWGFPEIQLACFPPVACVALAAAVGQKRAAEMVLTGQIIHGDEALHIGLVNDAVPDPELDARVEEVGEQLSHLSPAALRIAKKALYAWDAIHFDKGLARAEQIYLDELIQTEDAREGIVAWIEKRAPKWTGK